MWIRYVRFEITKQHLKVFFESSLQKLPPSSHKQEKGTDFLPKWGRAGSARGSHAAAPPSHPTFTRRTNPVRSSNPDAITTRHAISEAILTPIPLSHNTPLSPFQGKERKLGSRKKHIFPAQEALGSWCPYVAPVRYPPSRKGAQETRGENTRSRSCVHSVLSCGPPPLPLVGLEASRVHTTGPRTVTACFQ